MNCIFDNIRSIVAIAVVTLALGLVYIIAFHPIPPSNKDIMNIALGSVLTGLAGVVAYYFGSSKNESDKTKNEQINLTNPPPPQKQTTTQTTVIDKL